MRSVVARPCGHLWLSPTLPRQPHAVARPSLVLQRYGSVKVTTRMGGIFEPFLDHAKNAKTDESSNSVNVSDLTLKDLLPSDDQLLKLAQMSQSQLNIEQWKEMVGQVLKDLQRDKIPSASQLGELAKGHHSELSGLGNALLRSSPNSVLVARELYRCAMEQGDDRGAFSFANMLYRGYGGTPKDEDKGIQIMSALAKKGHPFAQMNLGSILMRTSPDRVNDAIKLYEMAGRAGVDQAYTELGRMFRFGFGVHQDHKKAITYFEQGAAAGNPQCHFMLGVYYSSGLGTSDKQPDQTRAFRCFQKAAIKGMPEAQYNVGLRYLKGHGVETNAYNAAEFFRMAAMQGFQLAQVNLAGLYTEGNGVKKNVHEATEWLTKAAAKGGSVGKDAQRRLDELQNRKPFSCTIM